MLITGDDFSVAIMEHGSKVAVRVRRHHASRRLRLRYDPVLGELRLTMPPRQRLSSARTWVEQQQVWIARQIAKRPEPVVVIEPGSTLPWDEGAVVISWQEKLPRTPHIVGNILWVGGPLASIGPRIRRWLQAAARQDFTERTYALAARAGLTVASVAVGDPRGRWGSCTASGKIRYNWRLVMAPQFVRRALVAHEVAHLAHMNHGPDFHRLADHLGGDANARSKAWLKANGPMLHALRFD